MQPSFFDTPANNKCRNNGNSSTKQHTRRKFTHRHAIGISKEDHKNEIDDNKKTHKQKKKKKEVKGPSRMSH